MKNQQIVDKIGLAAMYEQLAEEATELAHAALKYARIIRGENPTPIPEKAAAFAVIEELSDVELVSGTMGVFADLTLMDEKRQRWCERLEGIE